MEQEAPHCSKGGRQGRRRAGQVDARTEWLGNAVGSRSFRRKASGRSVRPLRPTPPTAHVICPLMMYSRCSKEDAERVSAFQMERRRDGRRRQRLQGRASALHLQACRHACGAAQQLTEIPRVTPVADSPKATSACRCKQMAAGWGRHHACASKQCKRALPPRLPISHGTSVL